MTDKLPRVNAADAVRVLEKAGFFLARQSGSHRIYKNAEGAEGHSAIPFWQRASSEDFKEHFERCGHDPRRIS